MINKLWSNTNWTLLLLLFFFFACETSDPELTDNDLDPVVTTAHENGKIIDGQYIVVLKSTSVDLQSARDSKDYDQRNEAMTKAVAGILSDLNITTSVMDKVYNNVVTGFSARLSTAELAALRADERVAYIEPDRIIALAPPPGKGKPGDGDGGDPQEVPWGIDRVGGFVEGATGTAWVIDSGIDLDHPDLNVNVTLSRSFLSGNQSDNPDDQNGHGTHVAGTIAAVNNDIGVVGVAAGATVVSVRVLDRRGNGSYSGVIAGVDYVATAASNGDVANMSLGGPPSQALDDAVASAASGGVKFTLAAGNEGQDANNASPARVNGANIYTISAMSQGDNWASFSNFGNPPVDYCAPGVSVLSAWKNGGYSTISGTSMAAPHAAGVLLLGNAATDGTVNGDPDGNADDIIHQ